MIDTVPQESPAQRRAAGRALRREVPRSAHDTFAPAARRRDPVEILEEQARTRVPELIPVRYERMLASPFTFFRGAAAVMAADLAATPVTGLTVQACGDAHVSNFGKFATPERNLVFDVNDFDETLPGPWEWDVKRLAASLAVCARERGFSRAVCDEIVLTAMREYRERIADYADLPTLTLWCSRIHIDDVLDHFPPRYRTLMERDIARARRKTTRRAIAKLTEFNGGRRRFIENPPLSVHVERTDTEMADVDAVVEGYRATLRDDRRTLFDRYRLTDVARRVVGVGSVGTRCWVALFEGPGRSDRDWLVLQVKEAQPSVLEPHVGRSQLRHHGKRVVAGQRLTQAASDQFLGWATGPRTGHRFYVRQLWDVKGASDPSIMDRGALAYYGALCGWALARAHARTGDACAISGYLGRSTDNVDRAMARFAAAYADQTILDHTALAEALGA